MVALVGCGSSGPTLKGKATIDSQPFVGTIYVVNLTTNQSASGAVSEKDGSFKLENAPVGKVKIYFEPGVIPTDAAARGPGMPPPKGLPPKDSPEEDYPPWLKHLAKKPALRDALENSAKLDPKFKSSKDSPLETEIKPGTNQFDVQLTSGH